MKQTLTLFAAILLLAVGATAQKLSYQAVVRNDANELVTGTTVQVKVSILNTSGDVQYAENHANVQTNLNGLLSLMIGDGTPTGTTTMADVVWSGASVRTIITLPGGASVTSVTPVNAVPYALYADNVNPANLPQIPENVSAFENDAMYVTNSQCDNVDICTLAALLMQLQDQVSKQQHIIDSLLASESDTNNNSGEETSSNSCPGIPIVKDVDGNVYHTVQVGNQCWMKENLRVKHYGDGTEIPIGSSLSYETAYRYCPNGDSIIVNTYGYLYNWKAVMRNSSASNNVPSGVQGICPTGWHVPSGDEWEILFSSLYHQNEYTCGSGLSIAKALADSIGWNNSTEVCAIGNDLSANNKTGFSALPAGRCYGMHDGYKELALFWTTSEYNETLAGNYDFVFSSSEVGPANYDKKLGFSVRCLKDEDSGGNTPGGNTSDNTPVIDAQSCTLTPTVTDVDGNIYSTLQIGNQCWMRENLRTVPTNSDYGIQGNTIKDAIDIGYYYYPNNNDEIVTEYGLLYNWTAATNGNNDFQGAVQGVCPNGWHLPSYTEYSTLRQYLDTATYNNTANGYRCHISYSIAKALAGTSNWETSSVHCAPGNEMSTNNSSKFGAPPAGIVWYANYVNFNNRSTFWTSTEHNNDVSAGYYFGINYDQEDAYLSFDNKGNGRSVRCLRD